MKEKRREERIRRERESGGRKKYERQWQSERFKKIRERDEQRERVR